MKKQIFKYIVIGLIIIASFYVGTLVGVTKTEYFAPKTGVETIQNKTMLQLLNETRAKAGKPPLIEVLELDTSAKNKFYEMLAQKYWGHVNTGGVHGYEYALKQFPMARTASENLAACFTSASEQNKGWENSPLHYQAMIGDWNGVGFYTGKDYRGCWSTVSHFIRY